MGSKLIWNKASPFLKTISLMSADAILSRGMSCGKKLSFSLVELD